MWCEWYKYSGQVRGEHSGIVHTEVWSSIVNEQQGYMTPMWIVCPAWAGVI